MHRPVRTAVVALTTVAAAVSLGACSSSSGGGGTGQTANGKTTISFMETMISGTQKPTLAHLVSSFEQANPKISVNLIGEPDYGTLRTKETAAIAAGNPPTIGQAYNNWAASYANSSAIVPLTTFADSGNELGSFYDGIKKDLYLPDGKLWMWPFNKSVIVNFYNKKMLADKNLSAPTTWAQFATAAKAVSGNGVVGIAIDPGSAATPQGGTTLFETIAASYGTPMYSDKGVPQFDSSAAVQALGYLVDLKKAGALSVGTNYPGQTALGAGKGLSDISTVASYPYDLQAVGGKFPMGVAPIPTGPAGAANSLSGTNIVVFAKSSSAQQQAAWKFMQFLAAPQQQAYWALNSGYLPVTSQAVPIMEKDGMSTKTPYMSAAVSQLNAASDEPPYNWINETDGDIATAMQQALSNGVSPASALKSAQSQAMSHMAADK